MNLRRLMVGAAIVGGALAVPHAASAGTNDPYEKPTTEVKGVEFETRPTEVKGVQVTQTLPFTGADVTELTIIGLGLVGVGTVLVRRSRPRRTQAA